MEKDEKRLTEHFRMDEFVYSAMAVELGLNNALPSEVIPAIRNLTVRLLESDSTSKNYNLPLDYYSNIVYNHIYNLIDFVKRNTPYSE